MAKVSIKSEKITPFGGIFSIMEQFDSMLSPIIDRTLGQRCRSIIGYKYSEIVRSLMSVYFCGGSCVEDVTLHFRKKGKLKNLEVKEVKDKFPSLENSRTEAKRLLSLTSLTSLTS